MRRFPLPLAVALAAICAPASAHAAKLAPITGTLDHAGYTVIAVGYHGKVVSTSARSFRLVPREARVTLQLRDPKGRYAGPIVVGRKGSRAVLGVRAGAKLGRIRIRAGYATLAKRSRAIDAKRVAQMRSGVPLGNGRNLGLERSHAHGSSGAGGDRDLDGVPNLLDIDANGNRVLDNEEGASGTRASIAQAGAAPPGFSLFSQLDEPLERSVNADAAGVSDAAIDALMRGNTTAPPYQPIGMFLVFSVPSDGKAQLDCRGLSYCSAGGSGRIRQPGGFDPGPSFPQDGATFGTLTPDANATPSGGAQTTLYPMASARQIASGDVLIERTSSGGTVTETPATLNFVFTTTPALASWTSSAGQSGTVGYPVTAGAPGTRDNPFTVSAGPDGHVAVSLSAWRPQRRAIAGAGEGTGFIDIGHLQWESRVVTAGSGPGDPGQVVDCRGPGIYSTTDADLTASPDTGLLDQSADAPASAGRTVAYTVDLTACLATRSVAWSPGQTVQLEIAARSLGGGDNTAQQVFFRLQ
jgi:hypothetical protein